MSELRAGDRVRVDGKGDILLILEVFSGTRAASVTRGDGVAWIEQTENLKEVGD